MTKTKVKDDIRLIDYLKEKGISHEQIKTMIEESIDTALEEKVDEEIEDEPEAEEPEPDPEVPTFTNDDIKVMIQDEVRKSLKIKRKVPSKGKLVDKTEIEKELKTKREIFAHDTYEQLV